MKILSRWLTLVAVALSLILWGALAGRGTTEDAKKTKEKCATCHVDFKNKPKELTDVGKCYKEKKTLEGCKKEEKK